MALFRTAVLAVCALGTLAALAGPAAAATIGLRVAVLTSPGGCAAAVCQAKPLS